MHKRKGQHGEANVASSSKQFHRGSTSRTKSASSSSKKEWKKKKGNKGNKANQATPQKGKKKAAPAGELSLESLGITLSFEPKAPPKPPEPPKPEEPTIRNDVRQLPLLEDKDL